MCDIDSGYYAITTRFIGPTNHRSSRIKATTSTGSLTVEWDYSLNVSENHLRAARMLADKCGWDGVLVGGTLPDDKGHCWVRLIQPRKDHN